LVSFKKPSNAFYAGMATQTEGGRLALRASLRPSVSTLVGWLVGWSPLTLKPLKMDLIEGTETSANINQTLGIHSKIETVNL
jgi:hypothetical protein